VGTYTHSTYVPSSVSLVRNERGSEQAAAARVTQICFTLRTLANGKVCLRFLRPSVLRQICFTLIVSWFHLVSNNDIETHRNFFYLSSHRLSTFDIMTEHDLVSFIVMHSPVSFVLSVQSCPLHGPSYRYFALVSYR